VIRRALLGLAGIYTVWAVGSTLYIRYWDRRWLEL
jgi:hypothetical protein